jgi:predicted phage baseplate assembly protein
MLPAPNLDDRTFQSLVDEAKRLVQSRCPEWTDHNVSDPGVTLIEAFAQMVDQLIYRLNRVPDLNYVKFLEMIGVELRPPAAATGRVTFWLSAPQPQAVRVRGETQVATPRTDIHDPIVFSTLRDLEIVPCSFSRAGTALVGAEPIDLTAALSGDQGFAAFSKTPTPGDALLIGLSNAVPSCAVTLRMQCTVSGVGVDPRRPPRVWEAWTGTGWSPCEVDHDETGGLNKDGDVVLHVPDDHQASIIARERAGWLRCRLVEALPDQPTYTAPPRVNAIRAFTIGGTVAMENAEVQHRETLGVSDGTPGQRFPLLRRPVLASSGAGTVEVETTQGDEVWTEVRGFAESGPEDRHYRLDHVAGEVQFGPAVRLADGSLRHYGAVPRRETTLMLTTYRSGGGRRGNVTDGQVRVLKTSVPYVARVENRAAAVGGSDAEALEDAKVRGPMLLRARGRAVTAEDFVQLARDVAPEAARIHCAASQEGDQGEGVLVLVVPNIAGDHVGRVRREDLVPEEDMLQRIAQALESCRLVGTRVLVAPPHFTGLTVVADIHARERFAADAVHDDVLRALYGFLDPLSGGPDGTGWPFGRSVQAHEVHTALARIPGVDMAQEVSVTLFPADPATGRRESPVQRLDLPPAGLVYSYEHQVRVQ